MSPPVSPCQWRYRGSGSTEPKGLAVSREAALLRGWKSCNVDSFRTPPPAAPPLSALSRGRGGHCYASATLSRKTRLSANTQGRTLLCSNCRTDFTARLPISPASKPSTLNYHALNSQPSTIYCYRQCLKTGGQKREGGGEKQTGMYAPSAHPCLAFGKNPNEPTKVKFI